MCVGEEFVAVGGVELAYFQVLLALFKVVGKFLHVFVVLLEGKLNRVDVRSDFLTHFTDFVFALFVGHCLDVVKLSLH